MSQSVNFSVVVFSVGALLSLFLWSRDRHTLSLIALAVIYASIVGAWYPVAPLSRFSLLLFLVGTLLSYFVCVRGLKELKAHVFVAITFVPIALSCLWSLLNYPFAGFLLVLVGISFIATVAQLIGRTFQPQHRCLVIFPLAYALDKVAHVLI
jgi:hypothetical protein